MTYCFSPALGFPIQTCLPPRTEKDTNYFTTPTLQTRAGFSKPTVGPLKVPLCGRPYWRTWTPT